MARPAKTDLEKAVIALKDSIKGGVDRPSGEDLKDCIKSIVTVLETLKKDEEQINQKEYEKKIQEIQALQKEAEKFRTDNGLKKIRKPKKTSNAE